MPVAGSQGAPPSTAVASSTSCPRNPPQKSRNERRIVRDTYTARLERKILLSAAADCYHFQFTLEADALPAFEPGQFLSFVADDAAGKTYTRAYSIASASTGTSFDLCVNRVEGGFFSNLLCDLREGGTVRCQGPHGLFTLRQPPADGLLIAASTGIAPLRGFAQGLFPQAGQDRSQGREYWLVYEAPHPDELFYNSYFQQLAAGHANFHYLPVFGRDGDHEQMAQAIAGIAPSATRAEPEPGQAFSRYAYVCGLGEMVKAARAQLLAMGWEKRQILFERYD